jgi:acyl-CoA thioesterase-1
MAPPIAVEEWMSAHHRRPALPWARWHRLAPALAGIWLMLMLAPGASLAAGPKILVMGDSLTAGLGLAPDQGFVAQMQAALDKAGIAANLINGGASGDTTATGLARLDWTLGDSPDAVLLELGGNDMLQGLPVAETRANLDAILEELTDRHLPVLLAGMKANQSLGADYVAAFDAIYPELARKYHVLFYPFFLEGVALDPALNQPDLIHPNARGVAVIVQRMLSIVEQLVAAAGK